MTAASLLGWVTQVIINSGWGPYIAAGLILAVAFTFWGVFRDWIARQ
jgi:hypothetical protein